MMRQADGSSCTLLRTQADGRTPRPPCAPPQWNGRLLVPLSIPRARPDPRPGTNNATPLPLREEPAPDFIRGSGGGGPAQSPGLTRGPDPQPSEPPSLKSDAMALIVMAGGRPAIHVSCVSIET